MLLVFTWSLEVFCGASVETAMMSGDGNVRLMWLVVYIEIEMEIYKDRQCSGVGSGTIFNFTAS